MATLVQLRRLIDEPEATTYTDAELTLRLTEAEGDANSVALDIWIEKLAQLSGLVDISEGGSSRKNSQAFEQARFMVDYFTGVVGEAALGGTVLRKIVRI
jgi:hypothetical protein